MHCCRLLHVPGCSEKRLPPVFESACDNKREERVQDLAQLGACRDRKLIHKVGTADSKVLHAQRSSLSCDSSDIGPYAVDCLKHLFCPVSCDFSKRCFRRRVRASIAAR